MSESAAKFPFHVICKPIGPICNLRCDHCFYIEKRRLYPNGERFRMSEATLARFIAQQIASRPEGASEVAFAWQGGEPTLMGLGFFRRAVELQRLLAPPGLRISNSLQTNGTRLTPEWGAFLRGEGFLVGISIDGPAELHDRYRRDAQGRGSLARALRGLEVLQSHQVEFNTLTCVQRHNASHPREVYRFLRGLGSRYMQFIPVVEHSAGQGVSPRSVHPRQFGRFLNAVFDCWRASDIGEVFVQHFDMMVGIAMGLPASLCVHAEECGRHLAMEHNGDLFQCDHFVDPSHLLGNLMETPLSELVDSERADRFGAEKREGLPGCCRRCHHLRFCQGGCPAHRFDKAPGGEPGLNHLCEGYRLFYRHTLPTFEAMAASLRSGGSARDYPAFAASPSPSSQGRTGVPRNAACPCGSGRKYKRCCGRPVRLR
jgi:uncharacterized protein